MTYPSYEPCEDSPRFDDDQVKIVGLFKGGVTRATFAREEPWTVFGAYRAGKDILAQLGPDLDRHVLVVVSHRESRAVFTGRILKNDLPVPSVKGQPPQGGELAAITSYFNVDLKRQCHVRPEPGRYWAVILLGPLVSPPLEFDVK